ncbi:MAG TPA: hypothetical protein VKB78_09180 [Pirellulales bacterium]|nr:hypothetical protein [Pirellulales bacterium]
MSTFDDYRIGDRVYCLAWIGKSFEIVAKNDEIGKISLRGDLETERGGAQIDIFKSTIWMLSHEPRDEIWHWRDRKGETYADVFDRFRSAHKPGDIVSGYLIEGANALEPIGASPERAMAFRIVMPAENMIMVEPVVGIRSGGTEIVKEAKADSGITWVSAGPIASARIAMTAYRWSIAFGDIVLNPRDFEGLA